MSKKDRYMLGVEADYSAGFHLPIPDPDQRVGLLSKVPMIGTLKYTWKCTGCTSVLPRAPQGECDMWPEGGVCGGGPPKCYFTRKEMASNLPSKMA